MLSADVMELDLEDLAALFPALILTDADLTLRYIGPSIRRLLPQAQTGKSLWDTFMLDRPARPGLLTDPAKRRNLVLLRSHAGGIQLRGLAIQLEGRIAFFVGHAPNTLTDINAARLSFDDFSAADASLDALLAVEVQRATVLEMGVLIGDLTEARERAVSADAAKGEFLANVSHEIRTPLTAILGFAELLSGHKVSGAESIGYVRRIHDGARSLLGIVNQILDWSKLERNEIVIEAQAFNPVLLAEDCVKLARGHIGDRPVRIDLQVGPNIPPRLWSDEQKVRQTMMNLLSNAVKFTSEGRVTLELGYLPDSARLTVKVTDTGCGIPEQALGRLFKRFSQADGSISRAYGGTGLGLAICASLLDKMGGEISVWSQLGVGSTFSFSVPAPALAVDDAPNSDPESDTAVEVTGADRSTVSLEGVRVLLADDSEANRVLISVYLSQMGCVVEAVNDGRQAVDAAKTQLYHVILMDLQMPVMDGLAATADIRNSDGANAETPVLIVSANVGKQGDGQWRDHGADDYLSKPLHLPELAEKVLRWAAANPTPHAPPI